MGVDRSDWIVVGVDIGMRHYDDENYEFFDQYDSQKKEGNMTFLIDGMSSQYFVVGELVSYANDYDGFKLTEIALNEESLKESVERVKHFINMNFDIGYEIEPKLMVLTHWT